MKSSYFLKGLFFCMLMKRIPAFFGLKLVIFRQEMLILKHMFDYDVTNQPLVTLVLRAVINRSKCHVCTPRSIGGVKQYVRTEKELAL